MKTITSIEMLELVATELPDLLDEVVFLGGAVVGILVTDPAAREPRATTDVDIIVEAGSRLEFNELESRLRDRGFQHDFDGHLGRFIKGLIILDIIPTKEEILGFSNPWYAPALQEAFRWPLNTRLEIQVISAPYFIATKLAAFQSRGEGDLMASHDFEDIVTVLDGRESIVNEIKHANGDVRAYIATEFKSFGMNSGLDEGISAHLEVDAASQQRAQMVRDRIDEIAAMAEPTPSI
jgi:hypothetical protein